MTCGTSTLVQSHCQQKILTRTHAETLDLRSLASIEAPYHLGKRCQFACASGRGHAEFSDAPDATRTEGRVAREKAIDIPMLMLIKQNGEVAQGWRGTPFYWPVLVAPKNTKTAIFASDVIDDED
jgi:hypothetical protein